MSEKVSTVRDMNKCACGNEIGADMEMCEWCEYPDVPHYKFTPYGLHQYECRGMEKCFTIQGMSVWATSIENARLIYSDAYPIDDGAE